MSDEPTILVQPAPSSEVVLEVIAGPHAGLKLNIQRPDSFLVGRGDQADLRLGDDLHFSRHHFLLKANPPECLLLDLGGKNGTFVNQERVHEKFLRDGDEISGGLTRIRVSISGGLASTGPHVDAVAPKSSAISIGQTFGSYDVLQELGRGSMGVVYQAQHRRTGREVALKVLSPKDDAAQESLQLFLREASVLSQLNHPLIVRFHEFGLVSPTLFLAMEYVPTVSLNDLMATEHDKGQFHLACGLTCQLLEALAHAHERGLIHRDIKPTNLLVSRSNRRLALKLADFGLAKNYWNSGCSGVTEEGTTRGTLVYMAPEQVIHCRDARPSCDIYSAAATLYWMLSARAPVMAETPGQTIKAVLETSPPSLSKLRPDLPGELVKLVHRGLAKEPQNRFASAQEFRHALQPYTRKRS